MTDSLLSCRVEFDKEAMTGTAHFSDDRVYGFSAAFNRFHAHPYSVRGLRRDGTLVVNENRCLLIEKELRKFEGR